jgi:phosphopantetheine--protein transferase-like protein
MIGNDIVDIAEAKLKSNWQRPRFLDKLFTLKEQQYIQSSDNSFVMVWKLWSMKEAAYKLYTQLQPSRFYNPKAFECDLENSKVSYKNFECFVKTEITSKYIVSEACLKEIGMTSKALFFNHTDTLKQSKVLKSKIIKLITDKYQTQRENLSFHKNEFGIPMVKFNSEYINVSLSHHGNYGVFAISNL